MLTARLTAMAAGAALLSGCAAGPVPVSALPGPNKDVASFNRDETACRTQAAQAAYPGSAPAADGQKAAYSPANTNTVWERFFKTYGECEAAKGNYVQPVPWAVAYGLYLGFGMPYPAPYGMPYPPAYGPPMAYGYP